MLYLVTGTVYKRSYMDEESGSALQQRIVDAFSEEEAREKFTSHFESKSSDYEVSYRVRNITAFETIY